jgi:FxLD family lantipeptide
MKAMEEATLPVTAAELDDADFDLDVRIIESGPVVPDLTRSTDDGCGSTCGSACTSCRS